MNDDLEGALKAYIKLLDEEEYFEAHEALEEAWHPLRLKKHPLANLAKGLINGAIAFEHIKRNRSNAKSKAQRVMVSYERHIYLCKEDIKFFSLFDKAKQKIEALKEKYKEVFTS
jgi:hypothetical protein